MPGYARSTTYHIIASQVGFSPVVGVSSTDVQAAIEELNLTKATSNPGDTSPVPFLFLGI